jgi:hypothetical protein
MSILLQIVMPANSNGRAVKATASGHPAMLAQQCPLAVHRLSMVNYTC